MLLCTFSLKAQNVQKSDIRKDSIRHSHASDTMTFIPRRIPDRLPRNLYIPPDRMLGLTPWMSAPLSRPSVHVIPVYGFSGYGFGSFTVDHWDKFFANLLGMNRLDVPQATELCHKLRACGVEIKELPLTEEECTSMLKEVLLL